MRMGTFRPWARQKTATTSERIMVMKQNDEDDILRRNEPDPAPPSRTDVAHFVVYLVAIVVAVCAAVAVAPVLRDQAAATVMTAGAGQ